MSKPLRLPSYRLHKATGQGVVTVDGRDRHLGQFNLRASLQRYHEMMANLLAGAVDGVTVSEVIKRYREHAAEYYRKDGQPTSEVWLINRATRHAEDLFGKKPAEAFDVLSLRSVREAIIDAGHCRTQVNKLTGRVGRAFRWATS